LVAVFARLDALAAAAERAGVLALPVVRAAVFFAGAFAELLAGDLEVVLAADFAVAALVLAVLAVAAFVLAALAVALLLVAPFALAGLLAALLVALTALWRVRGFAAGLASDLVAEAPALRLLRGDFARVPLEGVLSPVCAIARSFPHCPSYQGGDCRQSGLFPCALNASFTMLHQPVL
jgi:hypothetical protein